MSLLRRTRLLEARAELEAAPPGATVTRVALDCGFTHLGRFSQEYVRRFGERPSETLQRARGRRSTSAREMAIAS
jgi:transcriptional regulator GlxA family with amidase domain